MMTTFFLLMALAFGLLLLPLLIIKLAAGFFSLFADRPVCRPVQRAVAGVAAAPADSCRGRQQPVATAGTGAGLGRLYLAAVGAVQPLVDQGASGAGDRLMR